MNAKEFVEECFLLKQEVLQGYLEDKDFVEAVKMIESLALDDSKRQILAKLIDCVLTDCLYSLLLGLDGCARIGLTQQPYELRDANGNVVFEAGDLEAEAWEVFKSHQTW